MKGTTQITQETFDGLLAWFSSDREAAGQQYEKIRQGLIRFFRFRGCDDPEALSDETINRVARKLSSFTFDKNVKTITYFYSFASKIYLEDLANRKRTQITSDLDNDLFCVEPLPSLDNNEQKFQCLEKCLSKRPPAERILVIKYYSAEKSKKLELRKGLASELKLSAAALHTRLHRIRTSLRQCLEECLCEKNV